MNIEKIKHLLQQMRELDTYKVDTDSDGILYVERDVDGIWIDAFSVECILDEIDKELQ